MERTRGFTLMEMMVTVAIIGIIAAIAIPSLRAATRNASVNGETFDVMLRLDGLKTRALSEQVDYIGVLVDAPGNDGTDCYLRTSTAACTTLWILRDPAPGWTLGAWGPGAPGAAATVDDYRALGRGIRFAIRLEGAGSPAPRPFQATTVFESALVGDCGGRKCVAIRYGRNGRVTWEEPAPTGATYKGIAFAIGSDVGASQKGEKGKFVGEARAVFVAFPSGITRGFGVYEPPP